MITQCISFENHLNRTLHKFTCNSVMGRTIFRCIPLTHSFFQNSCRFDLHLHARQRNTWIADGEH